MNVQKILRAALVLLGLVGSTWSSAAINHRVEAVWGVSVASSTTALAIAYPNQDYLDIKDNRRQGYSMVDTATGTLGAYARVDRSGFAQTLPYPGGSDVTTGFGASFSELISISGSGAYVPVDIYMLVNGAVFTDGQGSGTVADVGYAKAKFDLQIIGVSSVQSPQSASLELIADPANTKIFTTHGDVINASVTGGILHATALVRNGSAFTLAGSVAANVAAPALAGAIAEASAQPVYFQIVLPSGYGWEGYKTGFMSAPAYPVPEPENWMMMFVGLAVTGGFVRLRANKLYLDHA